jgi:multiple sugar transport system permease protein
MKTSRFTKIWLLCGMIPVLAIVLFPFAVMITTALKTPAAISAPSGPDTPYHFIPTQPRLANFVEVFRAMPLARNFLNSLIIACGATLLNLLCAIPAAYALARLNFPGKKGILFLVLTTQMFSPIVLIIALFAQFTNYGMLEGARVYGALIVANAAASLAFGIWLLTGYFSTIPTEVEEAALIDGCSRWQTISRIIIPVSLPGVVTTVIFAFIAAWNEFVFALTFVSSDKFKPLTVAIPSFIGQYGTQWQLLMAAALLATIPVVVLFLGVEKHLVRGLTAGSIK